MERIMMSKGARCASEKFCFPLYGKKESKKKWMDKHDLFIGGEGKVFALVDTDKEVFFMDAITGSLYQFGSCLTSSVLKTDEVLRDRMAAESCLMGIKTEGSGGDVDAA